ncbi:ficolin-1-like [Armigeres subalbatus]|uniref:ficolin-1-like n=1 Tax=Armigeres subalbatus TaxID=124917 RepID=UPI002ED0355A
MWMASVTAIALAVELTQMIASVKADVHRRFDGTQNFIRLWDDYRKGFRDLQGEYWLGLVHRMHLITDAGNYELKIVMKGYDEEEMWVQYSEFNVAGESENYKLTVGPLSSGNTEDYLKKHNGMSFSTLDRDNDLWSGNCAELYESGWCFNNCHETNLNGVYQNNTDYDKFMWG